MGKRIRDYVKYTISELERYAKSPASCVNKVNTLIHLNFPPYGLSNFRQTLLDILAQKKIGFYDANLKGIILDIRNIKVIGDVAPLRFDDPAIHLNLQVDCYVFQPKVGAIIQGLVKHISEWQIGVIIYRVFSVSILLKGRVPKNVKWNSEIEFRVKQFDLENAMPFIEGELIGDVENDECENAGTSASKKSPRPKVRFDVKTETGSSGYNSDGSQSKHIKFKPNPEAKREVTKSPDLFANTSSSESEDDVQPTMKSESKKGSKLSMSVKLEKSPVKTTNAKKSSDARLDTNRNLVSDTDSEIEPGQKLKSEKLSQQNNLVNIKQEVPSPKRGKKSKIKKESIHTLEFSDIETKQNVKIETCYENLTEPADFEEKNNANNTRKKKSKTKLDTSVIEIKEEQNEADYVQNSPNCSVISETKNLCSNTQSKSEDSLNRKRKRTDSSSDINNSLSGRTAKKHKKSISDDPPATLIQLDSDFEMTVETPLKSHKKKKSKKHSKESLCDSQVDNEGDVINLENLSSSNDKKKNKKLKVKDEANASIVADNNSGNNGSFNNSLRNILDKIKAEKSV